MCLCVLYSDAKPKTDVAAAKYPKGWRQHTITLPSAEQSWRISVLPIYSVHVKQHANISG